MLRRVVRRDELNHDESFTRQTRKDWIGRGSEKVKKVEIKSKDALIESPAMTAVEGRG